LIVGVNAANGGGAMCCKKVSLVLMFDFSSTGIGYDGNSTLMANLLTHIRVDPLTLRAILLLLLLSFGVDYVQR